MPGKFQTFTPTDQRPELGDAVGLIKERIAMSMPTTAIVFPPRFGKSDVIRSSATELRAVQGGTSVVLTHWRFLAAQLLHDAKVKQMMRRLKMPAFVAGKLEPGKFWGRFFEQQPQRDLWTLTTAGACQAANLEALKDAATLLRERGEQLRVFVDESHSVSGENGWGEVVAALRDAGAHIILLTGTPLRSDNIAPFGFTVDELDRKPIEFRVPGVDDDDNPIFRIYAAEKVGYRLRADLEVTRKEAWDRGILTPIQARWFGFDVDGTPIEQIKDDSLARKAVGEGVRDPKVIAHAAEMMVDDVLIRRHSAPTSAAIVYVGNDGADETKDARHTNQVVLAIEQLWRAKAGIAPRVVIAMLKDTDAKEAERRIQMFVGDDSHSGVGDVLVVKQMGGIGLDADRIKTCLDLSTVRTIGGCIQRWLRVCTVWDGRDGKRLATNATLILPKDGVTEAIYNHAVTQQGGDFRATENSTLIEELPRDPGGEADELTIDDPHGAGVTNLKLESIDADTDTLVSTLLRQQPRLALLYDRLELAQCMGTGQFSITPEPDEMDAPDDVSDDYTNDYTNPDSEVDGLKGQINDLTKKLADRVCDYGTQRAEWVERRRRLFNDARRFSGSQVGLPYLQDVDQLKKQITYLQTRLAGG